MKALTKGPLVRCGSLLILFSFPSLYIFTRICAWSLLVWPTYWMDLGRSRWGVVPWSSVCELVWIDSLGLWMVLVSFRHLAYFVVLLGSLFFSSIRLMKTLFNLTRRWCCSIALSFVDLPLIRLRCRVWETFKCGEDPLILKDFDLGGLRDCCRPKETWLSWSRPWQLSPLVPHLVWVASW